LKGARKNPEFRAVLTKKAQQARKKKKETINLISISLDKGNLPFLK